MENETRTEQEKLNYIQLALRDKIRIWHRRMDGAVNRAAMPTVDESAPWANLVAMVNLAGGALSLVAPPAAVAWSLPLKILNTASSTTALVYANGAKITNAEAKTRFAQTRSDYLQRITAAADSAEDTPHAKALVKGIFSIVSADEEMNNETAALRMIKDLFEASQVIPTVQLTVDNWVQDHYTIVYQRALDII